MVRSVFQIHTIRFWCESVYPHPLWKIIIRLAFGTQHTFSDFVEAIRLHPRPRNQSDVSQWLHRLKCRDNAQWRLEIELRQPCIKYSAARALFLHHMLQKLKIGVLSRQAFVSLYVNNLSASATSVPPVEVQFVREVVRFICKSNEMACVKETTFHCCVVFFSF